MGSHLLRLGPCSNSEPIEVGDSIVAPGCELSRGEQKKLAGLS